MSRSFPAAYPSGYRSRSRAPSFSPAPRAPSGGALRKRSRTESSSRSEARKTVVLRGVTAFANRVNVTLKYTEQISMGAAAGGLAYAYYRANGLYDPTIAVGGHQPYGFDQWCTMYRKYCVHRSSIDVRAMPNSSSNGMTIAVQSDTDFAVTPTSIAQVIERPTVSWRMANNNERLRITKSATTESETGVPRMLQLADDRLCGDNASDPTLGWYWRIFGQPSQLTETWQAEVLITIYFNVTFFDHYEPGSS